MRFATEEHAPRDGHGIPRWAEYQVRFSLGDGEGLVEDESEPEGTELRPQEEEEAGSEESEGEDGPGPPPQDAPSGSSLLSFL